jgi:predicted dehydrogenase
MMQQPTRRKFFFATGSTVAAGARLRGADQVAVAVVGLGSRGGGHIREYADQPGARIVAVCDVNQAALERGQALVAKATGQKPKGYADMRRVFDDKDVQAVSLPLPNHWHALAAIWACQAGKDVYVEKPACHNPFEGQKMIEAARKYKRIVQVGSQSRSIEHKIKAIRLLQEGIIGKVYLAKGLCYKRRRSIGRKADSAVPPGLNWDGFLGPAPWRPYNELRFKYNWHWFWDTGDGDIGNQGIHEMDIARWGLGRGLPTAAVSTGGKYVYDDAQETPNTQLATFDYGDAELVFEVRGILTGADGGLQVRNGFTIGNLFYGSEGWMAVDALGFQVYKGENSEKVMDETSDDPRYKNVLDRGTNLHIGNFLKAVKSRNVKDLNADVEVGVASANLVHFANISYRVKRSLKLDPARGTFLGDDEADRLYSPVSRKPYVVPDRV